MNEGIYHVHVLETQHHKMLFLPQNIYKPDKANKTR